MVMIAIPKKDGKRLLQYIAGADGEKPRMPACEEWKTEKDGR